MAWTEVAPAEDFTLDGGECVKLDGKHIAIFNMKSKTEWYAIQNTCPHDSSSVLSRGITGDSAGEPKVACPLHKATFDLKTGKYTGEGSIADVETFGVKEESGVIYLNM